jgi:hypothetical protein
MRYVALNALSYKGTRIERGEVIDIDSELAASIGSDSLTPFVEEVKVEEPKAEDPNFTEMNKQELVELADSLGLKSSGTKADLIERLTLHYQAN